MIKLRKLNGPNDFKKDMTIVSVDKGGTESLERVDCIDNGVIYTESLISGVSTPKGQGEDPKEYFDSQYYQSVHEVTDD